MKRARFILMFLYFIITMILVCDSKSVFASETEVWVWPTADYYPIICPYLGYENHHAIDIYSSIGTEIYAARDGVVERVTTGCPGMSAGQLECGGGYGNYVTVKHSEGVYSRYAHLDKVNVTTGDKVAAGQKIGNMGASGRVGAVHLHFEIRENNKGMKSGGFNPLNDELFEFILPRDIGYDVFGWTQEDGQWVYYREGNLQTGWLKEKGNLYYLDEQGFLQTGWQELNQNKYFFNNEGVMQTGWLIESGNSYVLDKAGVLQTGWIEKDDKLYYANSAGVILNGWQSLGNFRYYFYKSGEMATSTVIDDFYINEEGQGMQIASKYVGWIQAGNNLFYQDGTGLVKEGWKVIGDQNFFFYPNGELAVNTVIEGQLLNEFGMIQVTKDRTGFITVGGKTYYYEDGNLKTGWVTFDETTYFFDDTGVMVSNFWLEQGDQTYYFKANGAMATGWETYQNQHYYFYSSGDMARNTTIEGFTVSGSGMAYRSHKIAVDYVVTHSVERLLGLGYVVNYELSELDAVGDVLVGTPGYEEALTEAIVVKVMEANAQEFNVFVVDNEAHVYYR